jgi:hypothetical protein
MHNHDSSTSILFYLQCEIAPYRKSQYSYSLRRHTKLSIPKTKSNQRRNFCFQVPLSRRHFLPGTGYRRRMETCFWSYNIAREACLPVRSSWWEAGSPDIQPKQASAAALVRSFASQVAEEILTLLPLPFTSLHLPTRECESVCETTVQKSTQRTLPTSWLLWLLA